MKKVDIKSSRVIFDDFFIIETYLSYERFDEPMSAVVRRLNCERGDSVAAIVFNITSQKVLLVNRNALYFTMPKSTTPATSLTVEDWKTKART